ncbi:MAG: Transcriptional regulator AraC family [Comamonadaceae bacterium]|nr:MAG: Transcriptional regulator AraC family [Comamonadaceae bacterium]
MPNGQRGIAAPIRLGLLLYPNCLPAGLFAVSDMVSACNLRTGQERVSLVWVGLDTKPIHIAHGPTLQAQVTLAAADCDILLVPGLWLTSVQELPVLLQQQQALIAQLRTLPKATQMWSYCIGVTLLAAAGSLEGKQATMTWWLCDGMRERFPKTQWLRSESVVTDGRIVTASGANGYLPLMLDKLPGIYGEEVMREVTEVLMLPQPCVRHDVFRDVDMLTLQDAGLRKLMLFAQRTAAQDLNLDGAASHLNLSVRTLCRLVQGVTGLAAGEWLRLIKLRQASEALRNVNASIKQICDELGYSSEASLHRAFKKATGLTLATYRQAYGTRAQWPK